MDKKDRTYILKRTVIEEFSITATSRAEAKKKGNTESYGACKITVVKETIIPSPTNPKDNG